MQFLLLHWVHQRQIILHGCPPYPTDSEVEGTEESVEQLQQSPDLCVDRTFVKPMRALEELSSFTSLSCLIKIILKTAVYP